MIKPHTRSVAHLLNGAPIGNLTKTSGRTAKDEVGRVYRITSIEEIEKRNKIVQMARDKRHFSFSHMRHIQEITRSLSNKLCGYVLLLQPYIAFKTNTLVREGRAGSPLTIDDLAEIWGVSKRTARSVIDDLEAHSIVFNTGGVLSMNERYHFRKRAGKGEVDALIKTYSTTLKKFRLSAADLGFVYKMLPNVHYETNLICADPFADPEDIRFLSDKELGQLVGMSETKTKEVLGRLRKAGIIGEWIDVDDKRKKFTALNPFVFYRKQGEPDGMLLALFANKRMAA